jgi:hypothetical protein
MSRICGYTEHYVKIEDYTGSNLGEIETFLNSISPMLYQECLRWYDTVTQDVFDVETTGENIINIFAIATGNGLKYCKPGDSIIYYFLVMLDVMDTTAANLAFKPMSDLV